ncbi:hypothetical protein ACFQ07_26005, partial [Actinomadura adrarensis]
AVPRTVIRPAQRGGSSTGSAMRLMGVILWDVLRGALRMSPRYVPMLGKPGELAVVVAGLHRHPGPRNPEETTRELAECAPHGELRRYDGTHFAFYTDAAIREKVVADQIGFYRRHLPAAH